MYDLVIRAGSIVDGCGNEPFIGDVAISGDRIIYVGQDAGPGTQEIDARGKIVTPGFVDVHTHYDGQAMWDRLLVSSAWHGITSVVMGNCGVGFAPAAPSQRSWLIDVMENVEDIPRAVLEKGMPWTWESFSEYIDALDAIPRTIDVGAQVPHVAVRGYVMGDRAVRNEPASDADVAAMTDLVEEALRSGALGFSCSRTQLHRMANGELVPASMADRDELLRIGDALKRAGFGVIQLLSDLNPCAEEFAWMEELSIRSNAPVAFALVQSPLNDEDWRSQLRRSESAKEGAKLVPHITPRGNGVVMSWQGVMHPFVARPSWKAIADKPWEEKLTKLRDPEFRKQLLAESNQTLATHASSLMDRMLNGFDRQYELGDQPDYEPNPATMSIAAIAAREGKLPTVYAYDVLMKDKGNGLIYIPLVNYDDGHLDHVRELMLHPQTVVSLSDGGAHASMVIDASAPTFILTHWARDRSRGETISLAVAVKSCTSDTATSYGLYDRGVIAEGYLADVNVIDFDRLKLSKPYLAFDLPAGGKRLLQRAEGYVATIKRGVITFRDGEHTGTTPGKVIRGPQARPTAGGQMRRALSQ